MTIATTQIHDTPTHAEHFDAARQLTANLCRLGSHVDLDGRVSWGPRTPDRKQPLNCYLLRTPGRAILIDTGVAAHREKILSQLWERLPREEPLSVFLTRPEPDCAGNVGAIHRVKPIDEIVAVAVNPFDAYEEGVAGAVKINKLPSSVVEAVTFGDPPILRVVPTRIRILSTYWLYDIASGTLFTSDWFGHTCRRSIDMTCVIDDSTDDDTTLESAKAHVLAKYWWLPYADTSPMVEFLIDLFAELDIRRIAPTHGCILEGRNVIARHLNLTIALLNQLGRKDAHR